jgi:L-asparaginase
MLDGVNEFIGAGRPVIVTSRTARGRVGPTYGYPGAGRRLLERGAILAGARRPQQARIELMLALGLGMSTDELRAVFEST